MTVDSDDDLTGLALAGRAVAEARDAMVEAVAPGVSTGELDAIGRDVLRRHGARSAPRLTYGFPGTTCISINPEIAHGVPSRLRVLRDGDLVNLDVSAELDGYWADTGVTVGVGTIDRAGTRLLDATRVTQGEAMAAARAGHRLRDIGRAASRCARRHGFHVVPNLNGHGIGRGLHEEPSVPSVDDGSDLVLWEGLVLAIEPFLSFAPTEAVDGDDGWTLVTADGGRSAQHEHTVVVTAGQPIVLTR